MAMMILLLRSISTGAPVMRSNRGPMATWSTGMANNAMKKMTIVRDANPRLADLPAEVTISGHRKIRIKRTLQK